MASVKWLWAWLSNRAHQRTLGFLGAGVAAAAIGGWQAYLHFATSDSPKASAIADRGSVAAGRDVHFGITLEQYEARLKAREAEIQARLEEEALEVKEKSRLEAELKLLQAKRDNLESSLEETQINLRELSQRVAKFEEIQLIDLSDAIHQGDASGTAKRLMEIERAASKSAAEAAYQQGLLAERSAELAEALDHFQRAERLDPQNQIYQNAVVRISPELGKYVGRERHISIVRPGPAQQKTLSQSEILDALSRNTVWYVVEGRVYRQYFDPGGTTTQLSPDGRLESFEWRVTDDGRYVSWSENRRRTYYTITGEGNHITWVREPDGYLYPGRVVAGKQLR